MTSSVYWGRSCFLGCVMKNRFLNKSFEKIFEIKAVVLCDLLKRCYEKNRRFSKKTPAKMSSLSKSVCEACQTVNFLKKDLC